MSAAGRQAVVLGAGPAGLAAAACLVQAGVREVTVLERAPALGASWRAHYRRLHLHTVKELSALPGLPFPAEAPRYVPRAQVVAYLEAYARHFGLAPRTGCEVQAVRAAPAGSPWRWEVHTADGPPLAARHVIVATGANARPLCPELPGQVHFGARVLHSRDYLDATPFAGMRVLVVGMGNTGAEIALDLCEQGVQVALSVRAPVNIVHRDVLGRPTQRTSLLLARLPPRLGDALAGLLRDLSVGDLSRFGLRTPARSPLAQLREEGRTPMIDVGTLARIRRGEIAVYPGVEALQPGAVRFLDGREAPFDAVILATGYAPEVQALFPGQPLPLDERGLPRVLSGSQALAGLHFVGFDVRQPGGLLRTIARQALAVAQAVANDPADGQGGAGEPASPGAAP